MSSHSLCSCLYSTYCLSGSACEVLKGHDQWLIIDSQNMCSPEITECIGRVLDRVYVTNTIVAKMAEKVINMGRNECWKCLQV